MKVFVDVVSGLQLVFGGAATCALSLLPICIPSRLVSRRYKGRSLQEVSQVAKPQVYAMVVWGRAVPTLLAIASVGLLLSLSIGQLR